jgi:hypothetical protein
MSEEKVEEWLGCPSSVKKALPAKIRKAVLYALDECLLEELGVPEAQREQWVYKEIKAKIKTQMKIWIREAIDEAIEEALQ